MNPPFVRYRQCAVWLFSVACLVAVGCGPSATGDGLRGPGDECDADHPCKDGLVCSPDGICVEPNDDGSVEDDGSSDTCPDGRPRCGSVCCNADQICVAESCVSDMGPCTSDAECQNDSYCHEDHCIPYGSGPRGEFNEECTVLFLAGFFQPAIQCEWTGPPAGDAYPNHVRVLSTPMVVDFDFDEDPYTIAPSIVMMTYDGDDGSSGYHEGATGVIRVIDGKTCTQLFNVGSDLNGCNPPALADLNLDGRPEIIAHTGLGGLATYTYDPNSQSFVTHCTGTLSFSAQASGWSGPSVYDLDDDGFPEIMTGGLTYDADCNILDPSIGLTGHMYNDAGYPVAADLDGIPDNDGIPTVELATGSELYRFDRATRTWQTVWSGGSYQGYIAVADFGTFGSDPNQDDRTTLDGVAEIVTVVSPNVIILTLDNRVIYGPVPMPSGAGGGPPTVGDFDGDGRAEVACSGSDSIAVFDPDCNAAPDPSTCASSATNGILWWQPSQDHSSNITGSSLFDFEGDGAVEVVYADEVFTRVYDGKTGEVLFSQWHSSCTWNENPVIADVDGDFNAELVVPSNENCTIVPETAGGVAYPQSPNGYPMDPFFVGLKCESGADCPSGNCDANYCRCTADDECGGTGSGFVCATPPNGTPGAGNTCRAEWRGAYNGVRVYADVLDRWVASRTIWNQHAYAVTHVSEEGIVTQTSQWTQNWRDPDLNNFRANTQGDTDPDAAPDMTGGHGLLSECNADGHAVMTVRVCNRGTQPVGQGAWVTFYEGGPADGGVLCSVETSMVLGSGECEELTCVWEDPPSAGNAVDVTVVADDDGTGTGQNSECEEENNLATIPDVYCESVN